MGSPGEALPKPGKVLNPPGPGLDPLTCIKKFGLTWEAIRCCLRGFNPRTIRQEGTCPVARWWTSIFIRPRRWSDRALASGRASKPSCPLTWTPAGLGPPGAAAPDNSCEILTSAATGPFPAAPATLGRSGLSGLLGRFGYLSHSPHPPPSAGPRR